MQYMNKAAGSGRIMNAIPKELNIEELDELIKLLEDKKNEAMETARKIQETQKAIALKEQERQKEEDDELFTEECWGTQHSNSEPGEASGDSTELSLDWDTVLGEDKPDTTSIHADSAGDGLIYSLKNLGRVDIEYISKITGLEMKDVISRLKGSIYQDPASFQECYYKGFKTSEEYLSGNLLKKLHLAKEANRKYNGHFEDNIEALESVMPKGVSTEDIYYTIASPWIPDELIRDFIKYLCKGTVRSISLDDFIKHDLITGTWEIRIPTYLTCSSVDLTYGTPKISAFKLLERILNSKNMALYDTLVTVKGKKRKLNKPETLLAETKAQELQDKFHSFVNSRAEHKKVLTDAYNEHYGYNVPRIYNGSFLDFPELDPSVELFDYQKNAVARILFNPNTLLAHEVGSGKTYIMIASGEELIRTGLSKKNLYIVPNNIVSQWESMYKAMYPKAKVLFTKTSDYTPENRRKTLEMIQSGDYTSVIMPFSSFDRIPLSHSIEIAKINKKLEEIREAYQNQASTHALDKLTISLQDRLRELEASPLDPDDDISFDKLGFDRIFVDEAHNYKNIPIPTKMENVKGINPQGSKKCLHMMDITEYMASKNGGVIMATGTPITNSISDAYTFQRYLQPGELKLMDIHNFDAWVAMFAENAEELEIDVDTSGYRVTTRFCKFHNLPELTQILADIADFHFSSDREGLPEFKGYTDVTLKKSPELANYLQEISARVDTIRNGSVSRTDDNMLKVTTDGRKAALDLRLVDSQRFAAFSLGKVFSCAETVSDIYFKTSDTKATQLVFCDTSTPKDSFNVYDELRGLLISFGVPDAEIAYIHDASTDRQRDKLFEEMRKGNVRIVLGSTFKLGLGVNVQERLYAIHHLDVPWRPADMVQREGRILRQGNTCPEVFIYRYIQAGSFDAYSWQLLETKQNFINELLSNSISERTREDIQDTMLSYGEVKALAIGNPLLKEHVEVKNQLNKLVMLQKRQSAKEASYKATLLAIPARRKDLEEHIFKVDSDILLYQDNKCEIRDKDRMALRKKYWFGMMDHLMADEPTDLGMYQGFQVIAPARLLENSLKLELHGACTHDVIIGSSETGVMIRIDNVLEHLPDRKKLLQDELDTLNERERFINEELAKNINYVDQIDELKKKLTKLNKKLKL